MLSLRQSGLILRAAARKPATISTARFYSAGHNEHHGEHHGEHHDDHHDDHSMPLSESESILNLKTGIAAGIVALVGGYTVFNSSYKESHDGASLSSIVRTPQLVEELQANYTAYRERVAKQKELQEMMMFPSERKTTDNLITRIDSVPGKYFPSGSNGQFNTIQDFDSLAPRKTKESPFY